MVVIVNDVICPPNFNVRAPIILIKVFLLTDCIRLYGLYMTQIVPSSKLHHPHTALKNYEVIILPNKRWYEKCSVNQTKRIWYKFDESNMQLLALAVSNTASSANQAIKLYYC
jgi:hypothetical protein